MRVNPNESDRIEEDRAVTRAREALITGMPPRVAPKQSEEIVRIAREHTARLRGAASDDKAPVAIADIPEMVVTLLGCHPDLYERIAEVAIQLLGRGALSHRDRELVVLRVGWLCQAPYEWGEHVGVAKAVGVRSDEIEHITHGSSASYWSEHERALLRAAEELHESAMISDATWDALSQRLDEKQLFELTVLVGQFTMVAYFQNALRLRLSAGNAGLLAR
jgi:alkylhydroperoxidase family enzyme